MTSPTTPALSGGVNFDSSTQPGDLGPSYFGTVTDQDGAAVPDAKLAITAPLLGRTIVQRSDAMGHFFVEGLDKSINPKDVRIICLKDGYAEGTASKTLGASPDAPVDVVCVLHKK